MIRSEKMIDELKIKYATTDDCKVLTLFNRRLIDDGGSINSMNDDQLFDRMMEFIKTDDYDVLLFELDSCYIGYALINKTRKPLFIRHFYIDRDYRRKGFGRFAFNRIVLLYDTCQFDLTVLNSNSIGYMFWKSCGLIPYEIYMHYRK